MSEKKTETIEQEMQRLNKIIEWFNGADFSLEEAFSRYNEAQTIADDIEKTLTEMKNKVTVLKKSLHN